MRNRYAMRWNSGLLRWALLGLIALGAIGMNGCKSDSKPESGGSVAEKAGESAAAPSEIKDSRLAAFQPLPPNANRKDTTPEKIALGRMLYHDKRLSKNHDVSCNSCHQLDKWGVDAEPTSPGHKKQRGDRNSPTVYNAALHMAQFWDGRAADVEEQAKGPVLNPVEMAMPDEARVLATLQSMPGYVEAFEKAFPGEPAPVHFDNMANAIGAFERQLLTPSRWDKFLSGDKGALTDAEKIGFNTFIDAGCATCHYGAPLGGLAYQRVGAVEPWPSQADPGRFQVTKNDADKMMFKVPSLRNIAKTGPYFHDGGTRELDEAVRLMAKHQLGKELSAAEVSAIVTWLGALTGEPPKDLVEPPPLPPSTDATPKPDPA